LSITTARFETGSILRDRYEVVVLGAGIVGITIALKCSDKGLSTLLIDSNGIASEASYGNSGLIEQSAVLPFPSPIKINELFKMLLNLSPAFSYDPSYLLRSVPWLWRYWLNSHPSRLKRAIDFIRPLIESSAKSHFDLARQAGAVDLLMNGGWVDLFRTKSTFNTSVQTAQKLSEDYNIGFEVHHDISLSTGLPKDSPGIVGGIQWTDSYFTPDPQSLAIKYFELARSKGCHFLKDFASSISRQSNCAVVNVGSRSIKADRVVIALGARSAAFLKMMDVNIPLKSKRGYHVQRSANSTVQLKRPIIDIEKGYVASPMKVGIRLTTGADFSEDGSQQRFRLLNSAEQNAESLMSLGPRLETAPWCGSRPCLPDMLPAIGPVPGAKDVWASFGHGHLGLTLGPITAELLVENMLTGSSADFDATPFRLDRSWNL
jgi:D-amino-acid dehydrogenase